MHKSFFDAVSLYPLAAGLLWAQQLCWQNLHGTSCVPKEWQQRSRWMQGVERLLKSSQLRPPSLYIPASPPLSLTCPWHWRSHGVASVFPDPERLFPKPLRSPLLWVQPFVRRDWSRGENFIFVLRSNLILNFSFLHQASTYANYPGVCEQTTCWATLGQISLFVSRNANKTTTNCTIWWDHRASAGKTLHKGEGTYCAANPRLRSKLLWKARVESSFASVVVFPSLKIRIRNLFTDYSIFL